jgi:hypothetical protein
MDTDAVILVEAEPTMHFEAAPLPGAVNIPDRLTSTWPPHRRFAQWHTDLKRSRETTGQQRD